MKKDMRRAVRVNTIPCLFLRLQFQISQKFGTDSQKRGELNWIREARESEACLEMRLAPLFERRAKFFGLKHKGLCVCQFALAAFNFRATHRQKRPCKSGPAAHMHPDPSGIICKQVVWTMSF